MPPLAAMPMPCRLCYAAADAATPDTRRMPLRRYCRHCLGDAAAASRITLRHVAADTTPLMLPCRCRYTPLAIDAVITLIRHASVAAEVRECARQQRIRDCVRW